MVADDLTGACDAGVAFARSGFRTVVLPAGRREELSAFDLVVLPTFSRQDAAADAWRSVAPRAAIMSNAGLRTRAPAGIVALNQQQRLLAAIPVVAAQRSNLQGKST